MKYVKFLRLFHVFRMLEKNGEYECAFSYKKFSMKKNLFGCHTFTVDDNEYVIMDENETVLGDKVIAPLCEAFEIPERYHIFSENMDIEKIKATPEFQTFLKNSYYSSPHTDDYVEMKPVFDYYEFEYDLFEMNELYENFDPESDDIIHTLYYDVNSNEFGDLLFNWQDNKKHRLLILTGVEENPNHDLNDELNMFFLREASIKTAINEYYVNEHYSNFEENEIAFNVKVHEDFVHEGLMKLGILNWDIEYKNRRDALSDFMGWIKEEFKECDVVKHSMKGKSGGYVCIQFDELPTSDEIEKICEEISKCKGKAADRYKTLEFYVDLLEDQLINQLEHLVKEGDGSSQLASNILKEINNSIKV